MTAPRIQDSVGTALRFVREHWRGVLITGVVGALATTAMQMLGAMMSGVPLLTMLLVLIVAALIYAVYVGLALRGGQPRFVWREGLRLFSAMAIIAFFMGIVTFVFALLCGVVLVSGPYASFLPQLQNAAGDADVMNRIGEQMFRQNPWPIVVLGLLYLTIWFYLTTRLYLAAPATIDRGRILTFETWSWSKHNVLRIAGARAILIAPAFVLATALSYLLGRTLGIDMFSETANPPLASALVFTISSVFFGNVISNALGAGLSTALYRDLGGSQAQLPPR
jgi:hypothetical protein